MSEDKKDFKEEILARGSELVERVKELIQQGNVRRIIIKKEDDTVLFEVPMTAGVAVGGVLTLLAPVIAALGAGAAFLAKVKIEVIRTDDDEE
jgi:hypothetical protein